MDHFPWTISWKSAHSSPLCARSLPFGWSHASFCGLISPCSPHNEAMLWAGAFLRSDLICACPGHRVLSLSFQPVICPHSITTSAFGWKNWNLLSGKFTLKRPVLVQVLNQCGKNHHGNTFSFILKSVVFILRRPGGSEGSTGRKPGPDGLWCSVIHSGGSWGVGWEWLHPSHKHGGWLASSAQVPEQAEEGNLSTSENSVHQCWLKTWEILRQRCPV